MARRLWLVVGLVVLVGAARLGAQEQALFLGSPGAAAGPPRVPLEQLAPAMRERVKGVLDRPSLTAKGPPETFNADPAMYRWLLEHPHVVVKLWQQMGARVADIEEQDGVYRYQDESGSEVHWHSAARLAGLQLWYAEGKVKPAALIPLTPFRAVVLLQYAEGKDARGKPALRHQVHFMLRCESRALSLAARILGASAPRLAEEYLAQLQMFYGGMAWYLYQDTERARRLFTQIGVATTQAADQGAR